ncbi:ABC transporter permease [Salinadaptatus halalkaliphilus]|uniref:ABC transporter permease n=1 Tax=Salinadaptatus halalkaliphilus TaxID=2419781 RepID=A0A4S3TP64_9EURY|nr:ABC transporter permease [Salinadaptatus halalkaliphilus]THE65013.1 ABC transporter permease [Salinadaptatus halalkaliphilus]
MSGALVRLRAVVGIAFATIRRSPGRTLLSVLAVALAVLAVTLLASLGVGVVEFGQDGLDGSHGDIWISSDAVDATGSGTANPLVGSHEVTADLAARDDVNAATPIAMHDVYIGTEPDELERRPAVGLESTHDGFAFDEGHGFETDEAAYADGRSTSPTTEEVVLDPATADELGASVGDTVYVGTSRETAPDYAFTVVGTSDYYSQFLGDESVTMSLADLQAVAGTTGTDRATFVAATVDDDAGPDAVAADLQAEYPDHDVRTSDEQVGALLGERPLIIASGISLVGLAVVGGIVLTVNLFTLVTAQQRDELAALNAIGLSSRLLAGTVGAQGVIVGVLGGLVGLTLTPVLVHGLNHLSRSVIGFDDVLRTPLEVYLAGFALAVGVGSIVALVTGWRAGRYARVEHLEE